MNPIAGILETGTQTASRDVIRTATAAQTPRQNRLLAALPLKSYQRLLPHLNPVVLPAESTLHDAGAPETQVYFPTAGVIANLCTLETGASAQFALIGREGLIGVASIFGAGLSRTRAVVTSPGHAYWISGDVLKSQFERDLELRRLLLRYTLALIAQIGQTAVCYRHHSLEQRMCRWLLSCLDRLPSNELRMAQHEVATVLGVRRVSITDTAAVLQHAGLIGCSRGSITVLDRPRLQARACECYEVVEREYDRLLNPANGL